MVRTVAGWGSVLVAVFVLGSAVQAAPIGFWRLDDPGATAGGSIGTTLSEFNPASLNGAGVNGASYSSDIPGIQIYDPVSGSKYVNRFSLDAGGSNARINVNNDPLLDVDVGGDKSFTIEFFMRVDGQPSGYNSFARRYFSGPGPDNANGTDNRFWQIDFAHGGSTSSFGKIRSRWDTPGSGVPRLDWDYNNTTTGDYVFVDTDSGSGNPGDYTGATGDVADEGDGINDDEAWHHIALVFNDATDQFQIFTDGTPGSLKTLVGEFEHPDASLIFGKLTGSTYGLMFDEVRYSSGALTPDQFLQAQAPEPSAFVLLTLGGLAGAAMRFRRRRRRR